MDVSCSSFKFWLIDKVFAFMCVCVCVVYEYMCDCVVINVRFL